MNLLNWLRRPFASQAINPVMKDDHAQHFRELNGLLGALDKLNENPDNNESDHNQISIMLRHILGEIAAHFHRERELMDCYGYPAKDAHQAEHSAIMKDMERHSFDAASGSVIIDKNSVIQIRESMISHIKSHDRKLNEFLLVDRPVGKLGRIAVRSE